MRNVQMHSNAKVFLHLGQAWEQSTDSFIQLGRPTLLIITCPKNADSYFYILNGQKYQIESGHTESRYLESHACLEILDDNQALALILIVCVDAATALGLTQMMPSVPTDRLTSTTTVPTQYIIHNFFGTISSPKVIHRLLFNAQIFEILYHQVNDQNREENHHLSSHYDKVKMAKTIIHEDLSKKITIPELAKIVGTNEQYLKKYFKIHYGKTIAGYTTEVKMEYARTLLTGGKHLIVDVSRMTGYKHATHFTTTFKKFYGFKPIQLK